jgi:hypothetical protein
MRKPRIGEPNLGALIGATLGAVGGLFAVTIPYAILTRNIHALSMARSHGLIGFLVSAPVGWLLGGQIAGRLEGRFGSRTAGIVGGIIGGLVPVSGFVYWGWRMVYG